MLQEPCARLLSVVGGLSSNLTNVNLENLETYDDPHLLKMASARGLWGVFWETVEIIAGTGVEEGVTCTPP